MNTNRAVNTLSAMKKIVAFLLETVSKLLKGFADVITVARWAINFIKFRYLEFVPRSDDIFIVTYPRSGTTWMQMILYQLATEGNMDFEHISQVCPWFERAAISGRKFEDLPSPRIFKSHLAYKWIPKGPCKYIYVVRNVKDVAVSNFHFSASHFGYKKTFSEFFDIFMRGKLTFGSWFDHVTGWWTHQDKENVLFLRYEDLIQDLEGCLYKIADFCGFEVARERFPEILARCSFAFMKQHESKFDFGMEKLLEEGIVQNSFIRKGKVNKAQEYFTEEQEKTLEKEFKKYWELGLNFGNQTT